MQRLSGSLSLCRNQAENPLLQIVQGADAHALLEDADFVNSWRNLHAQCPWATAFQGTGFAATWYRIYRERFRPVIVYEQCADGSLSGLLPLAADATELVFAGAHQAEYHAWLGTTSSGSFIVNALTKLRSIFPGRTLHLRYAPPGLPLAAVLQDRCWRGCCILQPWSRPLLQVGDGSEAAKILHKRRHNYKLNSLQKEGELKLRRLIEPADLEAVLDDIIARYDSRHQAVHQCSPFAADPLKKAFYQALLQAPAVLHATVLTAGEQFLAAHLGVCDQNMVHLGITAYSQDHARHYPGKILILKLGSHLAETGFSTFDLTPGGDAYKEQFATDHDEVQELKIHFSRWNAWRERASREVRSRAGRCLRALGWKRPAKVTAKDSEKETQPIEQTGKADPEGVKQHSPGQRPGIGKLS